ncbi:eukaryotic initiation factor 4A-2-like [Trifolium medium]|uniref:Eukaryotic initiation factor 4A-2-like n=1 Tax=Trifolium medium TaxID=97028 RepID=A0A392PCU7_9FABA|nr:eukaryotic initiation factor 4A-2-like [Trifolium medium]
MDQNELNSGSSQVLITTDLAHSIDVQHVYLVINYDLRIEPEKYLNRVGRRGCFRKVVAINYVEDPMMLFDIQELYDMMVAVLPYQIADLLE